MYITKKAVFVFIYISEARGEGIPQPRYGFISWRHSNALTAVYYKTETAA